MSLDPEILSVFLEEAEGYLVIIADVDAPLSEKRRAAHGLRGASALLGLGEVANCAVRLRQKLLQGDVEGLAEQLEVARGLLLELKEQGSGEVGELVFVAGARGQLADRAAERADPGPLYPAEATSDWDPETAMLLLGLFTEEAQDHLEAMISALTSVTQGAADVAAQELLELLLRKAHTLKGSAATVGLDRISAGAHLLEDYLVRLRQKQAGFTPLVIELLLRATDLLRALVEEAGEVKAGPALDELRTLLADLEHAGERPTPPAPAQALPQDSPAPAQALPQNPPTPLPQEMLEQESTPGGSTGEEAELPDMLQKRQQADRRRGPRRQEDTRWVRVDVERLDQLLEVVGELVIERTRIERRVEELKDLARGLSIMRRDLHSTLATLKGGSGGLALDQLSEVEAEQADAVTNLERASAALLEESEALRRTTHALQDHLLTVRMMPIRYLHARLQRPLWEMAHRVGKQVELVIHDEATEMDRSVVEQITDPLIHLLRNAVAHGIELPQARLAAGKPAVGRIEISARHQGDVIFLEVQDDGAGIDPARLRQALGRQREPGGRDPDAMGDEEVLDIIFTSGFSTREETDDLSGRGVGLDVVRQNISQLGGDIRVSSRPGQGTRFIIQMPMTTTIARALLFKAGDQVYAIPVAHVAETRFVEPEDLKEQDHACRLRVDGSWIPLLYLHRLLGTDPPLPLQRLADPTISRARQPIIVIRLGEMRFGITCTRIVGPREIVLKGLSPLLAPMPLFAAATVSGSNKVQFVLDVAFLARVATLGLSLAEQQPSRTPRSVLLPEAGRQLEIARRSPARILLVDDSRSVRETISHILRSAGLAVDTAADGREAWAKLQIRTYDLLLTDLEMPQLHGFELISRCRQSPALLRLPIVVLSSKTALQNRTIALERGADLFLAKPVARRVLLQELRSLLQGG